MATETSVLGIIRASRPSFRNAHDKLAFATHASFLASGYALVAAGRAALSDPTHIGEEEVGIEGWNEFEDSYGFVYVKERCKALVKCVVIGDELAIDVVKIGDGEKEPFNLLINVKDYVADSSSGGGNYRDMYKNFTGLVNILKSSLLDKLEPESSKGSSSSSSAPREHENTIQGGGHAVGVPVDPQPLSSGLVYPAIPPSGFSDIDPGIGAGVFPERGRYGDGGMLVGPNDPRWFGRMEEDFHPPGRLGGIPGVPPGARFDPYGPPGVPGFEPGRFVRQPRRPGGGVHPDLPHFQGPDYI